VKVNNPKEALNMKLMEKYNVVVFTEVPTDIQDIISWNK